MSKYLRVIAVGVVVAAGAAFLSWNAYDLGKPVRGIWFLHASRPAPGDMRATFPLDIVEVSPSEHLANGRIEFYSPGGYGYSRARVTTDPSLLGVEISRGGPSNPTYRFFEAESPTEDLTTPGDSFTEDVKLLISGNPFCYPFDTYTARFNIELSRNDRDYLDISSLAEHPSPGSLVPIDGVLARNLTGRYRMDARAIIGKGGTTAFELYFTRPLLQPVMYIMFFLFALVGGFSGIQTREKPDEILAGVVGIVLTVWGLRSIVMAASGLDVVTLVDATAFAVVTFLGIVSYFQYRRATANKALGAESPRAPS